MKAIENDTQFLSSKFVMDYSLLCGFDQVNNEIVGGIIGELIFDSFLENFFLLKSIFLMKRLFKSFYMG